MRRYHFHLIGSQQPLDLEVVAETIAELNEIMSRQRFIEGRLVEPDGDGFLAGTLVATARIQCVIEA